MKKRLAAMLSALLIMVSCAAAQGAETETMQALHDELAGEQKIPASLHMDHPFAPLSLPAARLTQEHAEMLRQIGLEEDIAADFTGSGRRWSDTDSDGRTITVVFYSAYGDFVAVFQTETDGTTVLLDVLMGTSDQGAGTAELLELKSGRYLLTGGWGHGTGTGRDWTNWYNLDSRKMELRTLRSGYESYGNIVARAVAHTNADHALNVNGWDMPDPLITYTYTSVYEAENGKWAQPVLLDEDCTVRVYHLIDGGMAFAGERVYENCPPGIIEQLTEDEIFDPDWRLTRAGEDVLHTASIVNEPDYGAMLAAAASALPKAKVINVSDFVYMRREGDKETPAVAQISAGDTVYVISENNGFESGWTHALYFTPEGDPVMGYIWWSFLEKR